MNDIRFFSGPTPNGREVAIMLHECGLDYEATFIDIPAGDQLTPEFLALNPNNKHPAIVDPNGPGSAPITVWESGAILIYLGETCGRRIPTDARRRIETLKWLFFQVANEAPYAGQYAHSAVYAKEEHRYPYAIERYRNEVNRQFASMDAHLLSTSILPTSTPSPTSRCCRIRRRCRPRATFSPETLESSADGA